jgi:hypothetical protein
MRYMTFLVEANINANVTNLRIDSIIKVALIAMGRDLDLSAGHGEQAVVAAALVDSMLNGTAYGYGRRLRSDEDGPDVSDAEVYSRWVAALRLQRAEDPERAEESEWTGKLKWPRESARYANHALMNVLGPYSELVKSRDEVWRHRVEELRARLSPWADLDG